MSAEKDDALDSEAACRFPRTVEEQAAQENLAEEFILAYFFRNWKFG
jgi:hypothetical protein